MRPIHIFIVLVLVILLALAGWYWWHREYPPAEVEIALDHDTSPDQTDGSLDGMVDNPISAPPGPRRKPDIKDGFGPEDCTWLVRHLPVRHVPDPDVAYQPGVDARGNPVAPADLDGGFQFELPETITASISRRLLGHPNLRQESSLGEVVINLTTGEVSLNGQVLDAEEEEGLVAFCHRSSD